MKQYIAFWQFAAENNGGGSINVMAEDQHEARKLALAEVKRLYAPLLVEVTITEVKEVEKESK